MHFCLYFCTEAPEKNFLKSGNFLKTGISASYFSKNTDYYFYHKAYNVCDTSHPKVFMSARLAFFSYPEVTIQLDIKQ